MSKLTQADQYLLQQIRQSDPDAWTQLVDRYHGRLVAFARSRMGNANDAEDLVQETFLSFLKGVQKFREEASLETYLFTILRRRIVDHLRGKNMTVCLMSDTSRGDDGDRSDSAFARIAGADQTASFYARADEADELRTDALSEAMSHLVERYKEDLQFRDLQIAEMVFYAQMRNKDIAAAMDIREQHVALIKHRWIKQIREGVTDAPGSDSEHEITDDMMTRVWEVHRLSCPKRSTIGAWLLSTLDSSWQDYITFHVDKLGCRFCLANADDLRKQNEGRDSQVLRDRILQSTVGFLK